MANIERRHIRIEDWEGNIYYPETQSGSSLAGRIVDAEDATTDLSSGSLTITEGTIVSDNMANNGQAIMISSPSVDKILFQTAIAGIPLGKVAISMRMSSNVISDSLNLFRIETYHCHTTEQSEGTLIRSITVPGSAFSAANKYTDIDLIDEFTGRYATDVVYKIKIIALAENNATLYFDQISVAKSMPTHFVSDLYGSEPVH